MHPEPQPAARFDMNTDAVIARLIKDADTKHMKEMLTFLASEPHLSGTDRSERVVVDYILKKFKDHGLDTYEKVPYDILNQYPDPAKPNKVQLLAADKTVLMDALMHEKDIPGIKTAGVPAYLAYAKPGTVEADVIFVNKGTYQDFDKLEAENISVVGHICLSQYGGGHRGNKIRICAERGGIGTILFADPKSIAHSETVLYPNSSFMPGTAMQRGALYTFGDPETPGYPSIKPKTDQADGERKVAVKNLAVETTKRRLADLWGKTVGKAGRIPG
ncbi:glutamate carboxypeptidase, putative [Ixodes scapularis]|uniref:Glutamate carboxypeptidase, putative n=1 Tax=Ixodes scapularis TaxID=6945 RepID=B7QCP1_IXOSC|nr:glutamate carboxypeptidase, putative [Ixodes scapularis]|eukprot:XP_002413305.1 glutamate carboxypeptidase, putative [Ixodes scapularis]